MSKTLPGRAEIPVQYTWNLAAIYPTDAGWEADYAALAPLLDELAAYQGRLSESAATLYTALALQDQIGQKLTRVAVYAFLRKDEDTKNATYQALADRAQQIITRVGAAASFVRPELLALPAGTLDRFLAADARLGRYGHTIEDLLREKPHVLSEAEETLLAQAGELSAAPGTIFHMLADADLVFGTLTDEEGEEADLTEGRFLRAAAYAQLHTGYMAHRNTLAATFATNVKRDLFFARARKYSSALEAALHPDNIPPAVYARLIDTVHDHLGLLHRYLNLRRRVLKLDQLYMYDLHVPLVADTTAVIPYDEAVRTILAAMAPLGPEYVATAERGFNSRWVDVYETPNKRAGAYSWGAYDTDPYILMNYQDTMRDMFTLAHELGHTMHSYFTRRTQPYIYGNYTIFVAEVASTLNEALLTHYLLQNNPDPRTRLAVVNNNLDGIRGTLYRQTMLAEFERTTHALAEAGEALTADRLSAIYANLNRQYHGPEVVTDEHIAIEWARIPHFYSSFYVYKYATGLAAAQALAQGIITEGAPAVNRYLHFLSRGSSAYSIDLLREAGVDMTSPAPVAQALRVFGDLLDEMERLLAETGAIDPSPARG